MGATPDQLEREIEQTRAELSHTIALIEQRVSPARLKAKARPFLLAAGGGIAALVALILVRRVRR